MIKISIHDFPVDIRTKLETGLLFIVVFLAIDEELLNSLIEPPHVAGIVSIRLRLQPGDIPALVLKELIVLPIQSELLIVRIFQVSQGVNEGVILITHALLAAFIYQVHLHYYY